MLKKYQVLYLPINLAFHPQKNVIGTWTNNFLIECEIVCLKFYLNLYRH
jgi:hypothetical protein